MLCVCAHCVLAVLQRVCMSTSVSASVSAGGQVGRRAGVGDRRMMRSLRLLGAIIAAIPLICSPAPTQRTRAGKWRVAERMRDGRALGADACSIERDQSELGRLITLGITPFAKWRRCVQLCVCELRLENRAHTRLGKRRSAGAKLSTFHSIRRN